MIVSRLARRTRDAAGLRASVELYGHKGAMRDALGLDERQRSARAEGLIRTIRATDEYVANIATQLMFENNPREQSVRHPLR